MMHFCHVYVFSQKRLGMKEKRVTRLSYSTVPASERASELGVSKRYCGDFTPSAPPNTFGEKEDRQSTGKDWKTRRGVLVTRWPRHRKLVLQENTVRPHFLFIPVARGPKTNEKERREKSQSYYTRTHRCVNREVLLAGACGAHPGPTHDCPGTPPPPTLGDPQEECTAWRASALE